MFAILYQFRLKQGTETEYRAAWNTIVCYFMKHRGAVGSCLHKTSDDLWIAYSRWPDRQTRERASFDLPKEIETAFATLNNCGEQKLPEIHMDVIDDHLL